MLKHYLKISLRSIWKDKGYSFINILGLAIALACCLLLVFWIKYELGYENNYTKANRIYRVVEIEERESGLHYSNWIQPGISESLKSRFPQIEASVFVHGQRGPYEVLGGEMKDGVMINHVYSSIDYLKMFDLEYLSGSPEVVAENYGTIITEEYAQKFFGKESPIGKTLSYGVVNATIYAVVREPKHTHINFDILSIHERYEANYGNHYVLLREGTTLTPQFKEDMLSFLSSMKDTENMLILQPIKEMHLNSPKEIRTGNPDQLILFSIATFLILVVAVVNYINSSVARALNRIKEVGVRKVVGSVKSQLILRFLCEYFIVSIVAVFLGMIFVKFSFPYFSETMGNRIALSFDSVTLLILLCVCLLITLLSGGYSAFYLSSLDPIRIFKGGSATGSKENLRKTLLSIQFFLSVGIITCTVFIYKQLDMMINYDTGVRKENILILNTSLWYDVQTFFDVIKRENNDILDATIALSPPYNAIANYSGVSWTGSDVGVENIEFSQIYCDHSYASVFGLEILEGEFIPPNLDWFHRVKPESYNIVINESFKKLMDEEEPIGITVNYHGDKSGKIIGVVKDFNFKPLRQKTSPLILSFDPERSTNVFIKTTGKNRQATTDYILSKYNEMKPDFVKRPVMYTWAVDDFNKMYETEINTVKILSVFTLISLVLSLMGMFSMIAFMIEKRTKELAIRKINGARIVDIVKLFIKDVLKVAFIGSIITIPICYFIMSRWLENYAYKTSLSWWVFMLIITTVLVISSTLIGIQVYITGRQNPIESLESE